MCWNTDVVSGLEALGARKISEQEFRSGAIIPFENSNLGDITGFLKHDKGILDVLIFSVRANEGEAAVLPRVLRMAKELAIAAGCDALDLSGVAFTNSRLKAVLERRGYAPQEVQIPEELGDDGTIERLVKRFELEAKSDE